MVGPGQDHHGARLSWSSLPPAVVGVQRRMYTGDLLSDARTLFLGVLGRG